MLAPPLPLAGDAAGALRLALLNDGFALADGGVVAVRERGGLAVVAPGSGPPTGSPPTCSTSTPTR